jgi:transcriptional regulator with PAS, ATPase and Fis domain
LIQNLTQQLDQFSGGPKAGDSFPKTFITNTLKPTSSNRTKAAKNLDVQRSSLFRLIKELDID